MLTPQLVSSNFLDDFIEDVKTYRPYTRRPRPRDKPVGERSRYAAKKFKLPKFKASVTTTPLPTTVSTTAEAPKTDVEVIFPDETKTLSFDSPAKVNFTFDFSIEGIKKLSFTYEEPQKSNLEKLQTPDSKSK